MFLNIGTTIAKVTTINDKTDSQRMVLNNLTDIAFLSVSILFFTHNA